MLGKGSAEFKFGSDACTSPQMRPTRPHSARCVCNQLQANSAPGDSETHWLRRRNMTRTHESVQRVVQAFLHWAFEQPKVLCVVRCNVPHDAGALPNTEAVRALVRRNPGLLLRRFIRTRTVLTIINHHNDHQHNRRRRGCRHRHRHHHKSGIAPRNSLQTPNVIPTAAQNLVERVLLQICRRLVASFHRPLLSKQNRTSAGLLHDSFPGRRCS